MKLAWATDVHLNFVDEARRRDFADQVRATGAAGLVLTGDIAEAPSLTRLLEELATNAGLPCYIVLGNHDFYHGSVAEVREAMTLLTSACESIYWLREEGVVSLSPTTALVGVGGWGDARFGDATGTQVILNDFRLIEELAWQWGQPLHARLRDLADEDAGILRRALREAVASHSRVVVATHVPPFREACWHEGAISADDWLPWFACKATGDVLREAARAHPLVNFEVLCGHTHSEGVARLAPNLVATTGAAVYRAPRVQTPELAV